MPRLLVAFSFGALACAPAVAPMALEDEPVASPAPDVLPALNDAPAVEEVVQPEPVKPVLGRGCVEDADLSFSVRVASEPSKALRAPYYDEASSQYVVQAQRGGRPVQFHIDGFDLTMASGNGNIIDVDAIELGDGVVLMTHHNLDEVVDPPRFFRSRWSEAYWLSPSLQSGDCPQHLPLTGRQHHLAWTPDPESLCIADAEAKIARWTLDEGALREAHDVGDCESRVAPRRDWLRPPFDPELVAEVEGHAKTVGKRLVLRPKLVVYAMDASWSCEACFEQPEDAPVFESTSLWVFDRRGEALRASAYYASIGSHCRAKQRGSTLRCGGRRFEVDADGALRLGG